MSLGKTIRALREARGWSNAELARRAKVEQPTMQRIEKTGSLNTTLRNAAKIAAALDVTIDTLMSGTDVDAIVDRLADHERRISALEKKPPRKRS